MSQAFKATLEAAAALGIGGRLVTLGGVGENFTADARAMLQKELELFGSRYCTRRKAMGSLALVARGEVWPVVTEIAPPADAQKLHKRLAQRLTVGRVALMVG